jgi:3-hydroxybutyryl-CoA dehydratase
MADPSGEPNGLQPGACVRFSHTLTDREEDDFIRASGDQNPLHTDARFAAEHGFGGRLAHGLLVAAIVLPALGRLFPSRGFVCLSQTLKYQAPVRVGDTVEVEATVAHVTRSLGVVVVRTDVRLHGRPALSGEVQAKLLP